MSGEVEALAEVLSRSRMTPYDDGTGGWLFRSSTPDEQARAVLASNWFAAHDAAIRAEILGGIDDTLTDIGSWAVHTEGEVDLLRRVCARLAPLSHCPCGCPREMHVGEIGCPCGTPYDPPCAGGAS